MDKCIDHLNFTDEKCPDCGLDVDHYGNTEDQFDHCSFPDCGCNGARLCMAREASERALNQNVEGMWSEKSKRQREAVIELCISVMHEAKE